MSNPAIHTRTREMLALSQLHEVFEHLKRVFLEGGGRSPRLANAIDHTAMALEGAGISVGTPPEFGDELEYGEDEIVAVLCRFN